MIEGRMQEAPWVQRAMVQSLPARPVPRYSLDARPLYRWTKRALDFALALVGLVLLSPVLAAIAVAIKLDSPGPVIFAQERMGKDGKRFTCYKFRSMVHNHGKEELHRAFSRDYVNGNHTGRTIFKPPHEDVVTRVGRFLRKTSLDELPQLWNILKGEMSFVGPRPLVTYEMEAAAPWQHRRLEALPGLTGLVQVSGRSTLTFDEMVRLDIYYIEHSSLWLDLKILLKTIPVVLSGESTR
jgi:lipopolysaccharide/colanic/teichoic acid biosynthesis glycosyltransferase